MTQPIGRGPSRRATMVGGAALAVAGIAPARAANGPLVVAHAAGINGQAVEAILKDYAAETGAKVTGLTLSDTDYGAKVQLAARTKSAEFDVALGVPSDVFQLTRGAGTYAPLVTTGWAPATLKGMQDAKLIGADYAVSQDTAAFMVYGPALAANPPKTWADFFDTAKYPGNRGMASGGFGVPINLQYASIAAGVDPDKVVPLNFDKALGKLRELGTKLVLWDNAPKGIQDMLNGDTVMTWSYAPAALGAIKSGKDIRLAAPPGTAVTRQLAVVMAAGPNNKDTSQAFLAWWFQPKVQVKYATLTNFGIVVPSPEVLKLFTPEQAAFMPFSGEFAKNYRTLAYDHYGEAGAGGKSNLAVALEQWNAFRAK